MHLNQPIVGMAADVRRRRATGWWPATAASSPSATPRSTARPGPSTSTNPSWAWPPRPTGGGYWLVASDGGIFAFGDAALLRLDRGHPPQPTHRGHGRHARRAAATGWWRGTAGIFAFGDAAFHGSTGGVHLNQPDRGHGRHPDGGGYWLVASDGGIFAFGDAAFHGVTGGQHLNQPIVGMAADPSGGGYWLVASDGGIFSFGDAALLRFDRVHPPQPADRGHDLDLSRPGAPVPTPGRAPPPARPRRASTLTGSCPPARSPSSSPPVVCGLAVIGLLVALRLPAARGALAPPGGRRPAPPDRARWWPTPTGWSTRPPTRWSGWAPCSTPPSRCTPPWTPPPSWPTGRSPTPW